MQGTVCSWHTDEGLGETLTAPGPRRWHLAVTDRKDSSLYLYNGMLLLFLFFVSRVALYGAGLLHLATLRQLPRALYVLAQASCCISRTF